MHLVFLTPLAALVALAIVLPLAAAALRERRDGRVRRVLGLAAPGTASRFASTLAAAALLGCLSAAAAQPAVRLSRPVAARADAQAFFVLDVSRSMTAASSRRAPTRFERAIALAVKLRRGLRAVPAGVASLSDRVLPHLFPTADGRVFAAVLRRSIGIGRPAPGAPASRRSTELRALASLDTGFFAATARRRLAIVLTDGESIPFEPRAMLEQLRAARIGLLLVRVWGAREAIYEPDGSRDPGYRPDPTSAAQLAPLAPFLVGGRVFDERQPGAATAAARRFFGKGPEVSLGRSERTLKLGQYAALAGLLPLLVLLRRNRG